MAFGGGGGHYCLGANLARREVAIFFEEFLERVGEIVVLGEPTYSVQGIGSPVIHSLKALPIRLSAR